MSYLINSSEILQTIEMMDQQHLDVRTVTMGISLLDCADRSIDVCCQRVYDKICTLADRLVETGCAIEREFGIPIVNKRISVSPISLVAAACEAEDYVPLAMTLDKAAKALDALHVEEIEALGKPFDPNFMNAVQQIPAPDGQESGTVITVYQKGYRLGDKIVRHATVVVAE